MAPAAKPRGSGIYGIYGRQFGPDCRMRPRTDPGVSLEIGKEVEARLGQAAVLLGERDISEKLFSRKFYLLMEKFSQYKVVFITVVKFRFI